MANELNVDQNEVGHKIVPRNDVDDREYFNCCAEN